MAAKAYKLSIPQLKDICDILGIDRDGVGEMRADLADTVLNFLGEPSLHSQKPHLYIEQRRRSGGAAKQHPPPPKNKKMRKSADGSAKRKPPPTKKTNDEEDDDAPLVKANARDKDYGDVDDVKIPDLAKPSDVTLRRWVRAFVRCHNMKTSTIRMAIEVASVKFGMDMSDRKLEIRELLVEEL